MIEGREPIIVDYEPGTVEIVTQHDGSVLKLRKLAPDYDPTNRLAAMAYLQERQAAGEIVTGLLYVDPEAGDLHDHLDTVDDAAQRARRGGAVPGQRGARRGERGIAVTSPSCPRLSRASTSAFWHLNGVDGRHKAGHADAKASFAATSSRASASRPSRPAAD